MWVYAHAKIISSHKGGVGSDQTNKKKTRDWGDPTIPFSLIYFDTF